MGHSTFPPPPLSNFNWNLPFEEWKYLKLQETEVQFITKVKKSETLLQNHIFVKMKVFSSHKISVMDIIFGSMIWIKQFLTSYNMLKIGRISTFLYENSGNCRKSFGIIFLKYLPTVCCRMWLINSKMHYLKFFWY